MKRSIAALAMGSLLVMGLSSRAAEPAEKGWQLELTPYAWLAGVDGTARVKGKEADFDQSFSDLIDKVDMAGSLIAVAENDRWQVYAQGDYFDLSDDGNAKSGADTHFDSKTFLLTAGAGPIFNGPFKGSTIAVLAGVRYAHFDNELDLSGVGSAESTDNNMNYLLILRPSVPLSEKWRFNPTLDVGAGDADLTYQLQPEFQYNFTDTVAGRIGYRRVYYKEDFSHDSSLDISFSGFIIGVGVIL